MYDVIVAPPFDGAVHVTVTVEPDAEAATLVGVPGTVIDEPVARKPDEPVPRPGAKLAELRISPTGAARPLRPLREPLGTRAMSQTPSVSTFTVKVDVATTP